MLLVLTECKLKEFLENFRFFFTVKKNSAIMAHVIKYNNKGERYDIC